MEFKAGKYKATARGFIFDRLRKQGDTVVISAEFLKANPKFSASWLELIEETKTETKTEPKGK